MDHYWMYPPFSHAHYRSCDHPYTDDGCYKGWKPVCVECWVKEAVKRVRTSLTSGPKDEKSWNMTIFNSWDTRSPGMLELIISLQNWFPGDCAWREYAPSENKIKVGDNSQQLYLVHPTPATINFKFNVYLTADLSCTIVAKLLYALSYYSAELMYYLIYFQIQLTELVKVIAHKFVVNIVTTC
jgi:hypothetical protein